MENGSATCSCWRAISCVNLRHSMISIVNLLHCSVDMLNALLESTCFVAGCGTGCWFFLFFFKLRNKPDENLFSRSDSFESRQSSCMSRVMCTSVTYGVGTSPWVALIVVARLIGLFDWTSIESRHVGQRDSRRSQLPWCDSSVEHGSPSSFFLLSFSLPSFFATHLVVAPLVILSSSPKSEPLVREIDSMSWYPNRVGYVCHLYRLILLYFKIFVWMNSCGRD
jgi:hypothetical protein